MTEPTFTLGCRCVPERGHDDECPNHPAFAPMTDQSHATDSRAVTIYGSSDDLIEIEGSVGEEFYARGEEGTLAFSDGTLLEITYSSSGIWRINRVAHGSATYEKVEAPPEEEDGNYSDRVTLTGDIWWVVYGTDVAR